MPGSGGDEGTSHHSFGTNVVPRCEWRHSSPCPSLLQDSSEGQDVRRHLKGGDDHLVSLRLGSPRSSGGGLGRRAAAPEVVGTHQQWWGLSGEPKGRVATSRDRGGCVKPRKERSHPGGEGRDETSKPRRQGRRLVEGGFMERREGTVDKKGAQGKGREEGRQRRRSTTTRRERRREGWGPQKRGEEEVRETSQGAPAGELGEIDGEEWSPSPGEALDCDAFEDAKVRDVMRDANNESTTPQVGDTPKHGLLRRNLEDPSSEEDPGRPSVEGLLQATTKGLFRSEDEVGGAEASPGCGRADDSVVSSSESPLAGVGCHEFGRLTSELWTTLLTLNLKHCKAQPTGKGLFPLPTVRSDRLDQLMTHFQGSCDVFFNLCKALNSLAGCPLECGQVTVSDVQVETVKFLLLQTTRFCGWDEKFEALDWDRFFRVKGVDYRGEEVLRARSVEWRHVSPGLPQEVGTVELRKVVEMGTLFYVDHFEEFLIPEEDMVPCTPPRVMVPPDSWEEMAGGLISQGICGVIGEDAVFKVKGVPVLNGLFGVSKGEWNGSTEIHRLIMNLIPINQLVRGIDGDVATLPGLSSFAPLWLDPNEELVVSSEDVRCFFYIFRVPEEWQRFMAFNRPLPASLCPRDGKKQRYYLCSRVLPMGFKNSVSIAQHIHRNVIRWAGRRGGILSNSSSELRKDRPFSFSNPLIRIYLDNYDQLEKFDKRTAAVVAGRPSVETLALRSEYESWGIPSHPKKTVCRQSQAEVQGAFLGGKLGIAIPKKEKVFKYIHLAYLLMREGKSNLKQAHGPSWDA